jgi:hypothetical protein
VYVCVHGCMHRCARDAHSISQLHYHYSLRTNTAQVRD